MWAAEVLSAKPREGVGHWGWHEAEIPGGRQFIPCGDPLLEGSQNGRAPFLQRSSINFKSQNLSKSRGGGEGGSPIS